MKTTFELRSLFDQLLMDLPPQTCAELSIEYGYYSPLHGSIDVIISRGDQCMALGRFRRVSDENPSYFGDRFKLAMGYPEDSWYLFDYDGENMVINDLSLSDPGDEFLTYPEEGLRRLITIPDEWHAEQKKFKDMKNFLEAMRELIDEEACNNLVN